MKNFKYLLLVLCTVVGVCAVRAQDFDGQGGQMSEQDRQSFAFLVRVSEVIGQLQDVGAQFANASAADTCLACERAWVTQQKEQIKGDVRLLISSLDEVMGSLRPLCESAQISDVAKHASVVKFIGAIKQFGAHRRVFIEQYAKTSNDAQAQKAVEFEKQLDDACADVADIFFDPQNDAFLDAVAGVDEATFDQVKKIAHKVLQELIQVVDGKVALSSLEVSKQLDELQKVSAPQDVDVCVVNRQSAIVLLVVMRDWIVPVLGNMAKALEQDIPAQYYTEFADRFVQLQKTVLPKALTLMASEWFDKLPKKVKQDQAELFERVIQAAQR